MGRWCAHFLTTVHHQGDETDMWRVYDGGTLETFITVGVPKGDDQTAQMICDAVNHWREHKGQENDGNQTAA